MTTDEDARSLLPAIAEARRGFMELVAELRPELHRYCARMTGSVFDGEDIVQDTLAKAYYALGQMSEPPPLRPWLFRIAHNTAMDFLKRYERRNVDLVGEVPDAVGAAHEEDGVDPALVEAALAVFVTLPPVQRSALVLKDVLGHSLEETAATMGTTLGAVKAALVRARANLGAKAAASHAETPPESAEMRKNLQRYADLFNARDWQALRALLGEESRLDLVSRNQRRGASVAEYYTRYAEVADREGLRAEAGLVDGVLAIAMFRRASSDAPAYFILFEWDGPKIALIRDFHYVPYVAEGARFIRW